MTCLQSPTSIINLIPRQLIYSQQFINSISNSIFTTVERNYWRKYRNIEDYLRVIKISTLFLDSSYGQQAHHNTPCDLCFEPQVYLLDSTHRQNANYNSNNNNNKSNRKLPNASPSSNRAVKIYPGPLPR